jgi:hypothetical protein
LRLPQAAQRGGEGDRISDAQEGPLLNEQPNRVKSLKADSQAVDARVRETQWDCNQD